jgi:dTDP-4-amino-4,6-dideoxygalactose transaminase
MTEIPFLDLRAGYLELKREIDASISRVLHSGWYVGGEEVEKFENDFASYVGAEFAVGVSNGLDALTLALRAFNIEPGDEVIVPANTYIATWLAVSMCGGKVVPVDPDPMTFNICPKKVEQAITSKTKFILPVHLYGLAADLEPLYQIAARFNLNVIEDGAQAHGAEYLGQRVGSHGATVAWSFYPGKNLGAMGDAGAVTTHDQAIANRLRRLRNYGSSIKYVNEERGYNSRLDPIQAAILNVKLARLDEWNRRRQVHASLYSDSLADIDLDLPSSPPGYRHVWHLYVVRSRHRDWLQRELRAAGVETLIHYPIPPYFQHAYRDHHFDDTALQVTNEISKTCLSLPIGPHLPTSDAEYVVSTLIELHRHLRRRS